MFHKKGLEGELLGHIDGDYISDLRDRKNTLRYVFMCDPITISLPSTSHYTINI